jgi:hypothetical protein
MSNTFNMARLDFYTLKSQMTTYMVIPTVALFFSLTGLSLSVLGFTAAWLVLIVNTNLFAIQEKYGLERLYSSLALNKKSVVLGRYISATLNYLFGYFVVIIVGVIISFIQGHANFYNGIIEGFCISLLTFTLVSAIQLPIYFVVGYTKGRIISMIPFLIIAGLVILQALNERLERVIRSVLDYGNSIYAICLISSIVIMVVSYYISVSCYKKRQ